MLRSEHVGADMGQLEERADKMLGMEDDLGADEYGHVINRTETTTTTTTQTAVTPQQRTEVIGLIIESAKALANPNTSLTQLKTVIENIRAGKSDDVVRAQLEKMKSGEVKQIQQPQPQPQLQPAPAHQQIEYGQSQQTTQNFQQNVQSPAPPLQQPAYAPAPQPQQPVQQQPSYAPTPQAMQPQPMQPQPMEPQPMQPQILQQQPAQRQPTQSEPVQSQPMQMQPMAQSPPMPAPKQKKQKFGMPPPTPAPVQQLPSIQYGAYAGQQTYTQTSTTTTITTTSSSSTGHAGQAQANLSSYQPQTIAPSYGQQHMFQQAPQPLQYQQPLQISQGQNTPPAVNYGQQGHLTQPQMAHAGQMGLYTPKSKKSKSKHLMPDGQPGGYPGMLSYPQQASMPASQQQPQQLGQYGQPGNLQSYQQAPAGQQYPVYDQAQQPVYSQELVPSSSALKPHKEKKGRKSSSKKEKKERR